MKIKKYGFCKKCNGPIFFNHEMDYLGNKINSLRCWNGHYEKIELEDYGEVLNNLSKIIDPASTKIEGIEVNVAFFNLKKGWNE